MRLLVWTLCAFPLGYLFEFFASLALGRSHFAYKLFEVLGAVYGWTIISALWAFLIVGPFRPYTEFSLRGDCSQRARIFFIALASATRPFRPCGHLHWPSHWRRRWRRMSLFPTPATPNQPVQRTLWSRDVCPEVTPTRLQIVADPCSLGD